jgi:ubiquinone/menaquinone biosynthesis C-methylase UbiE
VWEGSTDTRDPKFSGFLRELSLNAQAGELTLRFPPHKHPELSAPGKWNLEGDAAFAERHPESWNYLEPSSPNHALKQLEKAIYLDRLSPWMEQIPTGARVLDLGGGIGRFATEWATRGHPVTLVDPNPAALSIALGHLTHQKASFELLHLGAEDLSVIAENTFFALTAMEVFCYLSDPGAGFREAARVLRPGGRMFVSVESPIGSLEPSVEHSAEDLEKALQTTERAVEGDVWVRYFSATSLRESLEEAGLVVEMICGTHYLPDGPLHHLVNFERVGDPAYDQSLIQLERLLEQSATWQNRARSWVGVARKP